METSLHKLGMTVGPTPQPHRARLAHGEKVHCIHIEDGKDGIAGELHSVCRSPGQLLTTHTNTENQLVGIGISILVGAFKELL